MILSHCIIKYSLHIVLHNTQLNNNKKGAYHNQFRTLFIQQFGNNYKSITCSPYHEDNAQHDFSHSVVSALTTTIVPLNLFDQSYTSTVTVIILHIFFVFSLFLPCLLTKTKNR